LAASVVELLTHPEAREELTALGTQMAAEYDWSVVGAAYREAYEETVS
jgi:hypothetical protein